MRPSTPRPPVRVAVLTMDTPAAALVLEPLLADERFRVEAALLSRRVTGRGPLSLLFHLARVSGPRYVAWQVRRKLPAALAALARPDREGLRARLRRVPGVDVRPVASLHEPSGFDAVARRSPDLVVCAICPERLTPEQLALPPLGALNVHGSLLPRHRGITPLLHALAAGDKRHGATVHRIDAGLDTGPILAQESFPLADVSDYATGWRRTMEASAAALAHALDLVAEGRAVYRPQPTEGASYCSWPTREVLARVHARGIRLN